MTFNTKTIIACSLFAGVMAASCEKTSTSSINPPPPQVVKSASFVESFENIGGLVNKGWAFHNNSLPIGTTGWREGRYEPPVTANKIPVPYIGFQAYSQKNSPHDFVSCDATCVSIDGGTINSWLITPPISIKNGDQISFFTRAIDDAQYPFYMKDRMQVRLNITDGSSNIGTTETSVGSFTTMLLDINPTYVNNDPGGYPLDWEQKTITISGLTAPVKDARIGFRYMGETAGANGPNQAGVVGIDDFKFVSKAR